jgi:hypothetical protein
MNEADKSSRLEELIRLLEAGMKLPPQNSGKFAAKVVIEFIETMDGFMKQPQ